MAKKTASKKTTKQPAPAKSDGKVRIEVRVDPQVQEALAKLAEEAQLSLNQILSELLRWTAKYAKAGVAHRSEARGFVTAEYVKEAVWIGREPEPYGLQVEHLPDGARLDSGAIYCVLDFRQDPLRGGD
jgi:hypothetical protein